GGLAVEAEARGERRLVARLALLALEGFEERCFLAADVGAHSVVRVQVEIEAAAQDVPSEVAGLARFLERLLEDLVLVPDLAVEVVVTHGRADRIPRDDHSLDQDVGVVADDVAVLESARLALVGIADDVLLAREALRHERP